MLTCAIFPLEASVIVKQDEVGLLEAMEIMGWPIVFYTQDEMAPLIEEEKIG